MPDFLPESRRDYAAWVASRQRSTDAIERALMDLSEALTKAWTARPCMECPTGELAALAAATLTLYRESKR